MTDKIYIAYPLHKPEDFDDTPAIFNAPTLEEVVQFLEETNSGIIYSYVITDGHYGAPVFEQDVIVIE